jgi:hypothetical protein
VTQQDDAPAALHPSGELAGPSFLLVRRGIAAKYSPYAAPDRVVAALAGRSSLRLELAGLVAP